MHRKAGVGDAVGKGRWRSAAAYSRIGGSMIFGGGNTEHAVIVVTAVRHENVGVWIVSEEVTERLDSNDRAGDGVIFRDCLLEKDLQGFPCATAQTGKKLPVVKEISTQNLRDAEDEMPVRNLFEDIHAQPLPEFHHPFLMARGAKVATLAGKCQQVFMAAVFTFHTCKAVVQVAAIEKAINNLLDIWPPEAVLP
jgi:hypothetical protein